MLRCPNTDSAVRVDPGYAVELVSSVVMVTLPLVVFGIGYGAAVYGGCGTSIQYSQRGSDFDNCWRRHVRATSRGRCSCANVEQICRLVERGLSTCNADEVASDHRLSKGRVQGVLGQALIGGEAMRDACPP
jgi:hypothetical protein